MDAANGGRDSAAGAVVAAEAAVGVGAACVAPDAATGTVGSGVLTCAAAEEADVSATVEAAVAALLSRTCHQKVNKLSSYMCVFFFNKKQRGCLYQPCWTRESRLSQGILD